ncbi:MAG: hypothetical protein PHE51_04820 [Eubacteriales bacterium]|nr:hypothetical protein [Eubacteriales bacterium]
MDLIYISTEIQKRINDLSNGRKIIAQRSEEKAKYISEYEKKMAVVIMRLKNGEKFDIEGHTVGGELPANLIEKIARGVCWKEKMDMERADGFYRAAVSGMSSLESELNGLQSILRYLKEI